VPAPGSASATRFIALALLVAAAVIALIVLRGSGDDGHRLSVVTPRATGVVVGQEVREGGVAIGRVTALEPVREGAAAKIDLEFDDSAWPVARGSTMTLRWGGTVSFSNRYFSLQRAARGAALAEGGLLPVGDFVVPVEFDELLRTFDAPRRRELRRFVGEAGEAFRASRRGLSRSLDTAPVAVSEATFVLEDLTADSEALRTLVTAGDDVLRSVDSAEPDLRSLLSGAAATFSAVSDEADALKSSLDRAPQAFTAARNTLEGADDTLELARQVTGRLAPGVTELQRIARPLSSALGTIDRVGPEATAALADLRKASPRLSPLLSRLETISPQLRSIGDQAQDNLKCIRPYSPDMAGFISNWADFFNEEVDGDRLFRAHVQHIAGLDTNASIYNSGDAKKLVPGLRYAFPPPPGLQAGQPWFLPECGVGREVLDADKDPEARPFADFMKLPPLDARRGGP